MSFSYLYVPIGVPTFDLEAAKKQFDLSVNLLKEIDENVAAPNDMLLSIEALIEFLDGKRPDLIIVQNITFANSAYVSEILARTNAPILLWTLREPAIDGGRLRLNSLTGAYSAANAMHEFGRKYRYIFGTPNEENVKKEISASIRAAKLLKKLKSSRLLSVGHTPQGFGFGRAMDSSLRSAFGVELLSIEARQLIDEAKKTSDEDAKKELESVSKRIKNLSSIDKKNVLDFAKLYKSYKDFCKEQNISALSSRCWPDFFTDFGTPVCSVLSLLNDDGIPSACEADTIGALTMLFAFELTKSPSFFGDPVSLDEKENTITFWHCGMAPCSLACGEIGACASVHCNRKIGPTVDFPCKESERATIFRIGRTPDGKYRFFKESGAVVQTPRLFNGTTCTVKTDRSAADIINESVLSGWEPHFVVAYGDITNELEAAETFLNL